VGDFSKWVGFGHVGVPILHVGLQRCSGICMCTCCLMRNAPFTLVRFKPL